MHDINPFPEPKNLKERLIRTGHFHVLEADVAKVTSEDMKLPLYLNSFTSNIYIQIARWAIKDPILQSTAFHQVYHLLESMLTEHFRVKAIASLNNPTNYHEAVAALNTRTVVNAQINNHANYNNAKAPNRQYDNKRLIGSNVLLNGEKGKIVEADDDGTFGVEVAGVIEHYLLNDGNVPITIYDLTFVS